MGQARPKKLVCRAWEVKDKTDTTRSIHLKLESGININHLLKCILSLSQNAFCRTMLVLKSYDRLKKLLA